MGLLILTGFIFLITAAVVVAVIFTMTESPLSKRKLRARLAMIHQTGSGEPGGLEAREELVKELPILERLFARMPLFSKLEDLITQSGLSIRIESLMTLSFALAFVFFLVALVFRIHLLLVLGAGVLGGLLPLGVVLIQRKRRFNRFEAQFPDALDLLARAVRAGHAFTTGLELIATEMPDPLAGEFQTTFDQQNLGLPVRDALANLAVRMPLADVRIFVAALLIQRETGGNLGEVLDNLSNVIRERFKLMREVKTYTAEGRVSLYILTALPPITLGMMFFTNPDYISALLSDEMGHKMMALAVGLQLLGYFVIRKIIQIKV